MALTAIITGDASGIGRALASAVVAWGDTVADVDGYGAERAAIRRRTCRIEVRCA